MKRIIFFLDGVGEKIGALVSWVSAVLALLIGVDVIIRYVFRFTFIWMIETEIYLFGMIFLLGSGYTFKYGKHVRVDVFYAKMSAKRKAWVDLLGGAFLLIPWCYIVIVTSWYYGLSSFLINEGSPQPGGLPALYVLKFCITLGFSLLLLQGILQMLKSVQLIFNKVA